MGKLSDILRQQGKLDDIHSAWEATSAAGELDVLPKGEYLADIVDGTAIESRSKGTPGYRLTFRVADGDHVGSRFWHEVWFTENALPQTKRDLAKLGITDLRQLERPLPAVFRCRVKLVLRKDDQGDERNRIRRFEVVGIVQPEADPFAPQVDSGLSGGARASDAGQKPSEDDLQREVPF